MVRTTIGSRTAKEHHRMTAMSSYYEVDKVGS